MTGLAAILSTLLAGFLLLAFLYIRLRGGSLPNIRGPDSSSFWLGIFHKFSAMWISDQFDDSQVTRSSIDTRMKWEIASSNGCANMVLRGVGLDALA